MEVQLARRLSASAEGVWFGGVGDEHEAGGGGEVEAFLGEGQFADEGVVDAFDAGAVELDVV
jgi:hypothetical protein